MGGSVGGNMSIMPRTLDSSVLILYYFGEIWTYSAARLLNYQG